MDHRCILLIELYQGINLYLSKLELFMYKIVLEYAKFFHSQRHGIELSISHLEPA
jgi:hypothetical protein